MQRLGSSYKTFFFIVAFRIGAGPSEERNACEELKSFFFWMVEKAPSYKVFVFILPIVTTPWTGGLGIPSLDTLFGDSIWVDA